VLSLPLLPSLTSQPISSQGTFATAGADGVFNFWDKETKQRLKEFKPGQGCRMHQATQPPNAPPQPITSACFSPHVDLFAYASSYDWSRGNDANLASRPNDIYVHALVESDLKIPPPKR
jgi:mRNA export factor